MGFLHEGLAWLVTMQRDGGGRVSRKRRTAATARQYGAGVSRWALTGFPLGQDQVLDEDLNFQSVGHQPHHLVLASLKTNCPRFSFSLFVSVGFVNSGHALGHCWGFRCPFRFHFVLSCGILGLLLERYHLIHKWPSTVHVTAVLYKEGKKEIQ